MSDDHLEAVRGSATMEPRVIINITGTAGSGKTLITTLILDMLAKLEATNVTLEFSEASEDKYHLENFAAPEHTEFAINKLKNTAISVRDNTPLYGHSAERALLLYANTMEAAKNSIPRTDVKVNYDFSQNRNPKQITPAMNDFISLTKVDLAGSLLKPD